MGDVGSDPALHEDGERPVANALAELRRCSQGDERLNEISDTGAVAKRIRQLEMAASPGVLENALGEVLRQQHFRAGWVAVHELGLQAFEKDRLADARNTFDDQTVLQD